MNDAVQIATGMVTEGNFTITGLVRLPSRDGYARAPSEQHPSLINVVRVATANQILLQIQPRLRLRLPLERPANGKRVQRQHVCDDDDKRSGVAAP